MRLAAAALAVTAAATLACTGGDISTTVPVAPVSGNGTPDNPHVADCWTTADALGKPAGQDAAAGKTTFVTLLGIDGAKARVRDLLKHADAALAPFGAKGDVLRATSRFVAERQN